MTSAGHETPRGLCWDMPPTIVDKYFLANKQTEYFQYLTAKAICGHCAVRAACLVEAIQLPPSEQSIRGGESAGTIRKLHNRFVTGEASAEALAAAALLRQRRERGVAGSIKLRAGQFADVPLIEAT